MDRTRFFQILAVAFVGGLLSVLSLKAYENYFEQNNKSTKNALIEQNLQYPVQFANYVPDFSGTPYDFTFAAEMTVHAVVHIKTEYQRKSSIYDDFFGQYDPFRDFFYNNPNRGMAQQPIVATGSGVIISPDGYILTNNHVVQEADLIEVTLNNKESYSAIVIGTDPSTDLALLKIEAGALPHIRFGNSDSVRVGEWVLAVGNPFNLNSTVTAGIVSAKARNINILGRQDAIESFIQTDAAVNRGNSGGALVNAKGELIGINAAIASNTGSFTGYSFAVPVNIARKVAMDLLEYGQVQRAFLGVEIVDMTGKLAEEKNIRKVLGVYVNSVLNNGSGLDAGIKEGDIITHIDGTKVNSTAELIEIIATKSPGDNVIISYVRGDNEEETNVRLKNRYGNYDIIEKDRENIAYLLGATFENASQEDLQRLNISYGVKVKTLESGKLYSAGIREGFIITHLDRTPINSVEGLLNALKTKRGGVLLEGIYPNGLRAYYGFGL
ncbi:MAG: trypsin-like peptidase domain-containing protein [Bacteroidales bacterium]|nr:trypsin-like peptidase domain-containing protein [Bacteroidales bacterium]